jgi:hypothetical protein
MKIDITIPTDLSEIPLTRYQTFIEMQEKSNDEEFITQKMIQIFCGMELKEVMNIQLKDLNELIVHFTKVFKQKPKLRRHFKLGEYTFGFIPNLEHISFGEYVDIEHNLQDWKTYHKAMAVMFRPIKEKYKDKYSIIDYEPNEDMQELMKFAPLDIAIAASVFFYDIAKELLNATLNYLQKEMKTMTNSMSSTKEFNLAKNGNGTQASINALKEMSHELMQLQNLNYLNVSPILPLRKRKTKLKPESLTEK